MLGNGMQIVCITGIGKGIGKALAEKFLAEGFRVIGTYLRTAPTFLSDRLTPFPLNLADTSSIAACAEQIVALGERLDILVNNAGVLLDEEESRVAPEKLRATFEVNTIGTAAFTEQIIPLMNRGGHIVNISSTAGSIAGTLVGESHFPDHYPCYRMSKAALNMYTATLARRFRGEGITVSAVHPGWVRTDMGGPEADLTPNIVADDIYRFAITRPETGGFWFRGERLPW